MAILQALHLFVLASAAFAAPSSDRHLISSPALCDDTVSAFLVSDNTEVLYSKSRDFQNVTEDACRSICSNNKDTNGRSTLCASFTYDHQTFTCTVFRERSYPDGEHKRVAAQAKRHFEKVCLGEDLPIECAESEFVRADGYIVDGFATNVTIVKSLEECVNQCLREQFVCKSAMYFPEEGECITNTESAITKPDHFNREENDEVIYIQNGCAYSIAVQERLAKTAESAEEHGKTKVKKPAHKRILTKQLIAKVKTTTPEPAEETTEQPEETTTSTETSEEREAEESTTAASVEEESTEASKEQDDQDEQENSSEESGETTTESTTVTTTTTTTTTTEEPTTSTKRSRKHRKRPSKKTTTTDAPSTTSSATAGQEDPEDDEDTTEATAQPTVETSTDGELTEEPAKPDEDVVTKVVESATEAPETKEKPTKEEPVYFSDWSEWTACNSPGERKIRRRMCLNMKKCVGSLMEISWCPEDLLVQVEASESAQEKQKLINGPVGPVRAPLPVADAKITSEAGSPQVFCRRRCRSAS